MIEGVKKLGEGFEDADNRSLMGYNALKDIIVRGSLQY